MSTDRFLRAEVPASSQDGGQSQLQPASVQATLLEGPLVACGVGCPVPRHMRCSQLGKNQKSRHIRHGDSSLAGLDRGQETRKYRSCLRIQILPIHELLRHGYVDMRQTWRKGPRSSAHTGGEAGI